MKHQRAALQHEAEERKTEIARKVDTVEVIEADEADEVEDDVVAMGKGQADIEDNEDDIEYVVERLEMDDDELEASQIKDASEVVTVEHEEEDEEVEEEEEEDPEACLRTTSDEEDVKPILKKIKMEHMESSRDTLAEAMAHVHGEYLDDGDGQDNIELEMVVESEDQNTDGMHVTNVMEDSNGSIRESSRDLSENTRLAQKTDMKNNEKPVISVQSNLKTQDESGMVMACSLPLLSNAYQMNSPVAPTSNPAGVLQPINTIPITTTQNKTITLTSGGKTLTIMGGTFQPGAQYVLSQVKGKLPTLVMADKKSTIAQSENTLKTVQLNKKQSPIASTSQPSAKKNVKSPVIKRPRISTHVVDTSKGLPIGGLQVSLYKLLDGRWTFLNESTTSPSGRCVDLVDNMKVNFTAGRYKIHFDVDKYFTLRRIETMYPFIEIVFDVKNPAGQYHIPLLLSPFGYTTYRGSER